MSGFFRGDASEVYKLAGDLSAVGAKAVPAMRGVMDESGQILAEQWRSNAEATSGEHGVHYPKAITAELAFGVSNIAVDVGPDSSMPQGGMGKGFEYGSRNQPPHMDGLRAMTWVEPQVVRMTDAAIVYLFP